MPGGWVLDQMSGMGKVKGHPALLHPLYRPPPGCSAWARLALTTNCCLFFLSEVGSPGAHHLVHILHSDHEVSALCPLLLPGSPMPSFRCCSGLCSLQGANLHQASVTSGGTQFSGMPTRAARVGQRGSDTVWGCCPHLARGVRAGRESIKQGPPSQPTSCSSMSQPNHSILLSI